MKSQAKKRTQHSQNMYDLVFLQLVEDLVSLLQECKNVSRQVWHLSLISAKPIQCNKTCSNARNSLQGVQTWCTLIKGVLSIPNNHTITLLAIIVLTLYGWRVAVVQIQELTNRLQQKLATWTCVKYVCIGETVTMGTATTISGIIPVPRQSVFGRSADGTQ